MFELLKPDTSYSEAAAHGACAQTLPTDMLTNAESWLLASALASLLTSILVTVTIL